MRGGEVVARALAEEEVDYLFTVPAEHTLGILVSSEKAGRPKPVNACFEPGAGFMSVVYARVSGKVGVSVFTGGPGVFAAVSPIAMAHVESDPLVVVASTPPRSVAHRNALHALFTDSDQLSVFRSITKRQLRVGRAEELPEVLSRAFHEARSGRPGPVYVEVPADVLDEEVEGFSYRRLPPYVQAPDDRVVEEAYRLIKGSERPAILAGRGVVIAGAVGELVRLAEAIDAPVCTTVMAKGAVHPAHPLYAGVAAGRLGDPVAERVLAEADLVLAVGVRFSQMGTGRYSMKLGGRLIHVNAGSEDVGRVYKPELAVVADAKAFLSKLLRLIEREGARFRRGASDYLRRLWREHADEGERAPAEPRGPIEPWEVVRALRSVCDEDTVFVGDVGAHRIETFRMPVYKPRTYVTTTSYVSMGLAVPGAIAAKLARPDSTAVGVVGDGGFLMTGTEVATGVRYGVPAVIVVFNDSSYRVLRVYERVRYGTELTHKLPSVDFSSIAEALGAKGVRIEERGELRAKLEEALSAADRRPVVVDVVTNPEVVPEPMVRLYGVRLIRDLKPAGG